MRQANVAFREEGSVHARDRCKKSQVERATGGRRRSAVLREEEFINYASLITHRIYRSRVPSSFGVRRRRDSTSRIARFYRCLPACLFAGLGIPVEFPLIISSFTPGETTSKRGETGRQNGTKSEREGWREGSPKRFLPDRDFSSAPQHSDSLFRRSRPPTPNYQLPNATAH